MRRRRPQHGTSFETRISVFDKCRGGEPGGITADLTRPISPDVASLLSLITTHLPRASNWSKPHQQGRAPLSPSREILPAPRALPSAHRARPLRPKPSSPVHKSRPKNWRMRRAIQPRRGPARAFLTRSTRPSGCRPSISPMRHRTRPSWCSRPPWPRSRPRNPPSLKVDPHAVCLFVHRHVLDQTAYGLQSHWPDLRIGQGPEQFLHSPTIDLAQLRMQPHRRRGRGSSHLNSSACARISDAQ